MDIKECFLLYYVNWLINGWGKLLNEVWVKILGDFLCKYGLGFC